MKLTRSLFIATTVLAASGALQAQTFVTTTALPAAVPDPANGCNTPADPLNLTIPVSGITGPLSSLSVQIGLSVASAGDVIIDLVAPGGAPSLPLVGRIGANGALSPGDFSVLSGTYRFVDPSAPGAASIWAAAAAAADDAVISPGTYYTSEVGGAVSSSGVGTPLNATFAGLTPTQINGNWTLRIVDYCHRDATAVQGPVALTLNAAAPVAVSTLREWSLALLALICAAAATRRFSTARRPIR
ncbi:hypothetical protein FVQ98_03880 [Ottowia sp. GY511]|uniref:P/Homo B domain-containing protein n=1 Tax=Ottowia flava TaxID=2675430 RepID=A0ABW4KRC8_9BURK|nr:hypothetical protein [Ottowia sp. GY511]TXK33129.1 hypothetical protein FVQ98_03880 [Ottowia sp. GY511]